MNKQERFQQAESCKDCCVDIFVTQWGTVQLSKPWLDRLKREAAKAGRSQNWLDERTSIYKEVNTFAQEKTKKEFLEGL